MKYTQAQLLSLTGVTFDRLRHWRKEIPALYDRAGRKGNLSFEDVALVAVLSRCVDLLGIGLSVFAPHYEPLLLAFQTNSNIADTDLVLWLSDSTAQLGDETRPPPGQAMVMIRIGPILRKLVEEMQQPNNPQLKFSLAGI